MKRKQDGRKPIFFHPASFSSFLLPFPSFLLPVLLSCLLFFYPMYFLQCPTASYSFFLLPILSSCFLFFLTASYSFFLHPILSSYFLFVLHTPCSSLPASFFFLLPVLCSFSVTSWLVPRILAARDLAKDYRL